MRAMRALPGRWRLGSFASLVVLSGCGGQSRQPEPVSDSSSDAGIVAYVNDGDTMRLSDGRSVRLLQIDAPELDNDCFGVAALAALRALTPEGTRVTLREDPALDATDRYGRKLRYVFRGATNVNVALVRAGAASPYFFRNERGRYALELLAAVDDARAAGRGYWGRCAGARLNPGLGSVTGPR